MVDLNRLVPCWAGRAALGVAVLVLAASFLGGRALSTPETGGAALVLAACALVLAVVDD